MRGLSSQSNINDQYGKPDPSFDPLSVSTTKSVSSFLSDSRLPTAQNIERLDYLSQNERCMEMHRLVENQIKTITSKNLATNLHGSIHNPELLSTMINAKTSSSSKSTMSILKDPPLAKLK